MSSGKGTGLEIDDGEDNDGEAEKQDVQSECPYKTRRGFKLLIATIGTAATSTWICAGLLIQKFYMKHYRVINIILALTLLECIWSMLKA